MVSDKILWDTELSDNLVEHNVSGRLTIGFNCRHSLYPFREVVYDHYNVIMPHDLCWLALHKVHPPLGEGTDGDNRM